jgi:RNA 3'-terminal phosphate cyclase-like protein
MKELKPIQLVDEGMIKRIRGISYSARVSPTISKRIVESSKGYFLNYIPDVWIVTDLYKGIKSGFITIKK